MAGPARMTDVLVVGGGVIGLSVAWELARHGLTVRVLERGTPGREASWAGAGILPPGNPARAQTLEQHLRGHSCGLWPEWSQRLQEETGVDNGFRNCGGLQLAFPADVEELSQHRCSWQDEGVAASEIPPAELPVQEPALSSELAAAFELPELSQVRNPRHLQALQVACHQAGVTFDCGRPVLEILVRGGRFEGVRTVAGVLHAQTCVLAAGPWTPQLLPAAAEAAACAAPRAIRPVRGQIVLLNLPCPPFRRVMEYGKRYLVPRPDGRVLVGATEEEAGFDRRTTAGGVAGLLEFACRLVPGLSEATVERTWAGLRPVSPDALPLIGPVPGCEGLVLAAGHGRNGLQMSPVTGVLVRQLILRQPPCLPAELAGCSVSRMPAGS